MQHELLRILPGDPVIGEFSKYLPAEATAQKIAGGDYGDEEYYTEEEEAALEKLEQEEEERERAEEEEEEKEEAE